MDAVAWKCMAVCLRERRDAHVIDVTGCAISATNCAAYFDAV